MKKYTHNVNQENALSGNTIILTILKIVCEGQFKSNDMFVFTLNI